MDEGNDQQFTSASKVSIWMTQKGLPLLSITVASGSGPAEIDQLLDTALTAHQRGLEALRGYARSDVAD